MVTDGQSESAHAHRPPLGRLLLAVWPSGRLAVCATLAAAPLQAQDIGLPIGTQAQAVVIPDLEGVPQDLGQFIGKKPVLIQFWATWCSLCKALLPQLEKVKQTYGDRVELIGINVTVNESKSRARRYLAEHKPPYRVLWDEKGAGTRAYETPSTSYILVLNAAGKVVYTGVGSDQDLVAAVRKAVVSP